MTKLINYRIDAAADENAAAAEAAGLTGSDYARAAGHKGVHVSADGRGHVVVWSKYRPW